MGQILITSLLMLIWLSHCFVSSQDDEDDDEKKLLIKPTKNKPPTISISNNKLRATTIMPTTSKASIKKSSAYNTTINPYPTPTYGPLEQDGNNCFRPECLTYNCVTDSKLFTPNGTRNVPASLGSVMFICNKVLMFSKIEVNWTQAQEICCAINMRLSNIESYEQHQCFKALSIASGVHHLKLGPNHYWLSGSDEGCEGKWGWCDLKRPFASWIWWRGEKRGTMSENENCAILDCNSSIIRRDNGCELSYKSCSIREKFVCEEFEETTTEDDDTSVSKRKKENTNVVKRGECQRPQCLKYNCELDPNYVTVNGTIKIPAVLGKVRYFCNRAYLFGSVLINWTQAQEVCCSIGMRLLTITSEEQYKCIRAVNYNTGAYTTLGWNDYWVAGSDEECEGKYGWCATRKALQPWLVWAKGEPRDSTTINCIDWALFFSPLQNKNDHRFIVHSCQEKRQFICEVEKNGFCCIFVFAESDKNLTASLMAIAVNKRNQKTPSVSKSQKMPQINRPKVSLKSLGWNISSLGKKNICPNVRCPPFSCVVDSKYLEVSDNVPVPSSTGIIQKICGKKFMFSKIEASWSGAQEGCCDVDMRLYNVESQEQMQCILQQNIESGMHYNLGEVTYWTAGWELPAACGYSKTTQVAGWCNSRQVAEKWFTWSSQPGVVQGSSCLAIQYNVHVTKSKQDAKFVSTDCKQINKYICEEI